MKALGMKTVIEVWRNTKPTASENEIMY